MCSYLVYARSEFMLILDTSKQWPKISVIMRTINWGGGRNTIRWLPRGESNIALLQKYPGFWSFLAGVKRVWDMLVICTCIQREKFRWVLKMLEKRAVEAGGRGLSCWFSYMWSMWHTQLGEPMDYWHACSLQVISQLFVYWSKSQPLHTYHCKLYGCTSIIHVNTEPAQALSSQWCPAP